MTATATRSAVLIDFGGVLTTSLFDAFKEFGASIGFDPKLPLKVLANDPEAAALLAENEEGRIEDEAFEIGFAERLAAHGASTEAVGLIARLAGRAEARSGHAGPGQAVERPGLFGRLGFELTGPRLLRRIRPLRDVRRGRYLGSGRRTETISADL